MAQLSTLLERVLDEFPAVPEVLALRALADATKEFLIRTHIWRDTITDPIQVADSAKFVLSPGAGRAVAALLEVRVDGRQLEPVPTFDRRLQHGGSPRVFTQWSPAMLEMNIAPLPGALVVVKAALTLAAGATEAEVPTDLVDEYGEALAAGAKMRLVRQLGQPWANPEAGVMYGGQYYNAIAAAKGRVMSALGQAELRVEMRCLA